MVNQMPTDKMINVDDLLLNQRNYRIDFDRYNTMEKVIEKLYEDENIIEMIKGIVDFQGLYYNDRIIVTPKDDNKYIVMEGNRRVLAVKSILGKILIPKRYRSRVDAITTKLSAGAKESLKVLPAVVVDTNDTSYLKIIADKHSTIDYQRWGQISQWHFFADIYEEKNRDIESTANELGKNKNEVSNYIHYYNLIKYIRSLPYWEEKNLRDKIERNNLKATKFTRPLGYTAVLNELNIRFDNSLGLEIPDTNKEEFNYILCNYAAASLILDNTDDDSIYTRTSPSEIIDLIKEWKTEYANKTDQTHDESKNNRDDTYKQKRDEPIEVKTNKENNDKKSKGGNPVKYFSNLKCTVDSDRLKRLSKELSKINMTQFPAAAIMLTRSLLESALLYQIEKKGLKSDYYNYEGFDGLKKILNFSIKRKNDLFADPKAAHGLEYLENSKYKEFMDDIVHNKWIDPHETDIANIAGKIRQLLKDILTDPA